MPKNETIGYKESNRFKILEKALGILSFAILTLCLYGCVGKSLNEKLIEKIDSKCPTGDCTSVYPGLGPIIDGMAVYSHQGICTTARLEGDYLLIAKHCIDNISEGSEIVLTPYQKIYSQDYNPGGYLTVDEIIPLDTDIAFLKVHGTGFHDVDPIPLNQLNGPCAPGDKTLVTYSPSLEIITEDIRYLSHPKTQSINGTEHKSISVGVGVITDGMSGSPIGNLNPQDNKFKICGTVAGYDETTPSIAFISNLPSNADLLTLLTQSNQTIAPNP